MAEQVGKFLTELPELETPTDGDLMYIVDDETTSKKVTMANLKRVLGGNVTGTVEGASVSFSDGADGIPMEECEVAIIPIQTGSGTPSPSNVRPISGHTDVTVTVASTSGGSGEDTTVSLGRTVYGGTLDVTTGVLTVDKAIVDLGTLSWTNNSGRFSTGDLVNNISPIDSLSAIPDFICTAFKAESFYDAGAERDGIAEHTNKAVVIYCDIYKTKTGTEFANLMNGINLVYPLATPQTYNLTPTQVKTLLGQNYVSHDGGGNIKVVYIRDLDITINDLINRVTALENE